MPVPFHLLLTNEGMVVNKWGGSTLKCEYPVGFQTVSRKKISRARLNFFSCRNFCKASYVSESQSNTGSTTESRGINGRFAQTKTANICNRGIDPATVLTKILSNGECGCRGEDGNQ
jgi:hypothetical protein